MRLIISSTAASRRISPRQARRRTRIAFRHPDVPSAKPSHTASSSKPSVWPNDSMLRHSMVHLAAPAWLYSASKLIPSGGLFVPSMSDCGGGCLSAPEGHARKPRCFTKMPQEGRDAKLFFFDTTRSASSCGVRCSGCEDPPDAIIYRKKPPLHDSHVAAAGSPFKTFTPS